MRPLILNIAKTLIQSSENKSLAFYEMNLHTFLHYHSSLKTITSFPQYPKKSKSFNLHGRGLKCSTIFRLFRNEAERFCKLIISRDYRRSKLAIFVNI